MNSVTLALCGSGGAGVMTAADILLDAARAGGWHALFRRSSGPQIRGGEAAAVVRLASRPVTCLDDAVDILIAIDWQNVARFAAELPLRPDSLIVADPSAGEVPVELAASGARIAPLPLKDLARAIPGGRPNMVALGAAAGLIGLPLSRLAEAASAAMTSRHPEAVEPSVAAIQAGADHAPSLGEARRLLPPGPGERITLTGNEAAGMGALAAGIRFTAAYPITPATECLEWLAGALPGAGGTFVQAEDELASIAMCLGASFGGVPALTATSGPGLALMTESLGLAVAAEIPVVVVDVQRGGPSTGIPTKSEQSDLDIAIHGLHGDAPHLVVAPQSVEDCLFTTAWAVHLAEALQAPCVVLSDQSLGQSRAVTDPTPAPGFTAARKLASPDGAYRRHAPEVDCVSPMAIPGTPGGQYTADGLEHTETGTPSSQASDHARQLDKRLDKLIRHDYGPAWASIEGEGDIAVVTWGSSTGPAREAVERAAAKGIRARLVALRLLSPARPTALAEALAGVDKVLVVEQSHSGQFTRLLRAHHHLPGEVHSLHRPGPLPIRPGEILARIETLARED